MNLRRDEITTRTRNEGQNQRARSLDGTPVRTEEDLWQRPDETEATFRAATEKWLQIHEVDESTRERLAGQPHQVHRVAGDPDGRCGYLPSRA